MSYDLPNPFLFLPHSAVGNAAPVENPTPSPSAGAAPGYPCCDDCGAREPCDRHCPHGRFQLDEAAMLSEIEPVPAFLTRDNQQPLGAEFARVLDENRWELYARDGVESPPPTRRTTAEEIEALLELARAEEWPAPPSLRRANG